MIKKNIIQTGMLMLGLICLLATGCFMDKPLETTAVQGTVYQLNLKLPFAIKAEPKDMNLDPSTAVFVQKAQSCMERPTGEDLHMAEFAVNTFDQENINQSYGGADNEKVQQFYKNFGQVLTDSYIKSLTKAANMTDVSTESKAAEIDGREATVTTVQCKMKGEDETLKIIYINDPAESWLIALAYPKEKQDGIGRKIDETIIPGIKLVK